MRITMYKNYSNFGDSFSDVRISDRIQDKVSFNLKQDGETYHIYRNEAGNYIVKYLYDTNNYNYAYLHDFLKGDFVQQLYLILPQKYNRHTIIKCHNVEWTSL